MKLKVVLLLVIGSVILSACSSQKSAKNCDFVASYEATKNPQDSLEKQQMIYQGYYDLCKNPAFDYDRWKIENNIPEK